MKRFILVFLIILSAIAGFLVGFYLNNKYYDQAKQTKNSLPIPASFIVSPSLASLSADTEGKVINKTDDSLTIEKDGSKITLLIEEISGLTRFTTKTNQGIQAIKFKDISIGDYIKGGLSVITKDSAAVGMSRPRKVGDIIAHAFMVIKK